MKVCYLTTTPHSILTGLVHKRVRFRVQNIALMLEFEKAHAVLVNRQTLTKYFPEVVQLRIKTRKMEALVYDDRRRTAYMHILQPNTTSCRDHMSKSTPQRSKYILKLSFADTFGVPQNSRTA
jgi:hypothetical protein